MKQVTKHLILWLIKTFHHDVYIIISCTKEVSSEGVPNSFKSWMNLSNVDDARMICEKVFKAYDNDPVRMAKNIINGK
jgi:hypothetical protein